VKFIISCGILGGFNGNKGIHIRNAVENKEVDCVITVEPVFLNSAEVGKLYQLLNKKFREPETQLLSNY